MTPTGSATVAETLFASGRPDSVETVPAARSIVRSSFDDGRTPIRQRRFSPFTPAPHSSSLGGNLLSKREGSTPSGAPRAMADA